jgi:hypothetical protein
MWIASSIAYSHISLIESVIYRVLEPFYEILEIGIQAFGLN